jgi:hypothetical protein
MRRLTLYIPGLTGPAVPLGDNDVPPLPALSQILGRARRRRHEKDSLRQLCGLLGLKTSPIRDVPVAAVTRLIDGEDPPDGIWMRADPVHLSADRDRLLLIDASLFKMSQHDALALATEVQQVLDDQGWHLEVPFPDRWYIRLDEDPQVTTFDPRRAGGRDVDRHLPRGKGARVMHRLMNEVQMQLHDADINREREARGELAVNSIWFWGVGELPDVLPRLWSMVYSSDAFTRGLAMLSMTPCQNVTETASQLLPALNEQTKVLVCLEGCRVPAQYGDLPRWHDALADLEQHWFAPLLRAVQDNTVQELTVITDRLLFRLARPDLKKFWRRSKTVARFNMAS